MSTGWRSESACAATTCAGTWTRRSREAANVLCRSGPGSRSNCKGSDNARAFWATTTSSGVRQVRFHDLRHTFGTRMAASPDVAMRQIQEWMGHRDYRTTLI
ncbi:MAG: tyrosine-type recombinase/integrase [Solirubrobacterales bacterium]